MTKGKTPEAKPYGVGEDEGTHAITLFDRVVAAAGPNTRAELRHGYLGCLTMAHALGVAMNWTGEEVRALYDHEDFRWLSKCLVESYFRLVDETPEQS